MKTGKVFFPNLDGLRFLAFFSVFLVHSGHTESEIIKSNDFYNFVLSAFSYGTLGLSFFFVLSGFLITYLLCAEEAKSGKVDIIAFYIRRSLRIWPLYFLCVFFGFVIFPFLKDMLGQSPAESANPWLFIFFLSNFNNIINGQPDAGILTLLWSVSVEEQFYLFWPLLFVAFRFNRLWMFVTVVVISIVFRFIYFENFTVIYHHTLSYIGDMALGGLFGWLMFYNDKVRHAITNLPKQTIVILYILGFIIVGLKPLLVDSVLFVGFREIVFSLVFIFIILEQNFSVNSFYKISSSKFLNYWGKYTYGLYCLHFICILVINIVFLNILDMDGDLAVILLAVPLVSLLLTFAISWLSFNLFEKHFLTLKDKFAYWAKS